MSFTIGDAHVAVADDATKQISVYDNGKLVRTIPTSMGMGGTETIAGQEFSFWTQPGVYTVMDKANPVIMDSSTYGLPINSRLGYKETIKYAVRLSTDGVYLHQLESTVWAQGNTNVSHGCLNVNSENAPVVLWLRPARRCRGSPQHRRGSPSDLAERRLERAVGPMGRRERSGLMAAV